MRSTPAGVVVSIVILVLIVLMAIFAPLIAPHDPNAQNLLGRLKPPGTTVRNTLYFFGSDELGRDTLSRLIYGARVSLFVAVASVLLSGDFGMRHRHACGVLPRLDRDVHHASGRYRALGAGYFAGDHRGCRDWAGSSECRSGSGADAPAAICTCRPTDRR